MTIKTVPGTMISLGLSLCVEGEGGVSGGQHDIMGTPLRGTAWYGGQLWCNMANCTVNNNKNTSKLCRRQEILSFGFLGFFLFFFFEGHFIENFPSHFIINIDFFRPSFLIFFISGRGEFSSW